MSVSRCPVPVNSGDQPKSGIGAIRPLCTLRLPRPPAGDSCLLPKRRRTAAAHRMPEMRARRLARFLIRPNRIASGRRQSPLPDLPPARSPTHCLKAGQRDAPDPTKMGRTLPGIRSTQRRLTDTTTQRQATRTVCLKAELTPRTRRTPCRDRTGGTWHAPRPAGWA